MADLKKNRLHAIGSAPDPAGQYHSAYISMGNNPVSGVDPDGGYVYISDNADAGGGGYEGMHTDGPVSANWAEYMDLGYASPLDMYLSYHFGGDGGYSSAGYGGGSAAGGGGILREEEWDPFGNVSLGIGADNERFTVRDLINDTERAKKAWEETKKARERQKLIATLKERFRESFEEKYKEVILKKLKGLDITQLGANGKSAQTILDIVDDLNPSDLTDINNELSGLVDYGFDIQEGQVLSTEVGVIENDEQSGNVHRVFKRIDGSVISDNEFQFDYNMAVDYPNEWKDFTNQDNYRKNKITIDIIFVFTLRFLP